MKEGLNTRKEGLDTVRVHAVNDMRPAITVRNDKSFHVLFFMFYFVIINFL